MGADVRVKDGSSPLLRGVPLLAAGEIITGEDFPVVFESSGS